MFCFFSWLLSLGRLAETLQSINYFYHTPPFSSIRYPVKIYIFLHFLVASRQDFGFDYTAKCVLERDPLTTAHTDLYSGFIFVITGVMSTFEVVSRFF